jgi:hypothetical protein
MNEDSNGKYLRQVDNIRHLWHRYSITVNQVTIDGESKTFEVMTSFGKLTLSLLSFWIAPHRQCRCVCQGVKQCALFLVDCFFYFYEVCCIQGVLKKNGKKLYTDPLIFLNFTFRYIDDVLSPKNSKFYFIELEIKDSKDTTTSASRLDIHIDIDGEGRFRTTKEIMSIFQMKSSLRTFYCRHRSWLG